jgi:chromosome segregation ATPase
MFCFQWKSNQIAAAPPPDVDQLYNTAGAPLVNFQRHELANAEELETIQRCVEHAMSELYMAKQRAFSLMGNYRSYHVGWALVVPDRSNRTDPCFREVILQLRKRELVARRKYAELDAFFQLQTMLSNEKVIVDRLVDDMVRELAHQKLESVAADELQLAAVDEVALQVEAARVQAELKKENAALAEKMSCLTAREKELEEEVAQLLGEKRDAEAGLQALQVENKSLHSVVLELQAEKETIVLELQAIKARMAAEILALQLEERSMKTAIEFQVSEIAQLKATLEQSRRETAHYRDRWAEIQSKVRNLSMELLRTRDGFRELQGGKNRLQIIDRKPDVMKAQDSLATLSNALDVA